jgi:Oxidoreductase family, NAD-binding Rossmann fold
MSDLRSQRFTLPIRNFCYTIDPSLRTKMAETTKLRLGLIGAGEVAQVIHIPTLQLLDHLYSIVAICDVSKNSADHCASKFHIRTATTNPLEIITHPEIDVVFVLTSDEFHLPYTLAALQHGKHVFVEKPVTLSIPSAAQIVDAEKTASGPKVFVGYMRRYAPSFVNAFKREIATVPKILYARSRDIIGPNSHFVAQSGAFPVKVTDFPLEADNARKELLDVLFKECFEGQEVTLEKHKYCRFLGGLGSHDLSLMREALGGLPVSVAGVSVNEPFYSAIFNYRNKDGSPFAVTYESGIDLVPRFDAHLAVYGERKTVSIHYDTP